MAAPAGAGTATARASEARLAQRAIEPDVLTGDLDIGVAELLVAAVVFGDGALGETATRPAVVGRRAEALQEPRDLLRVGVLQRPPQAHGQQARGIQAADLIAV